MNRSARFAGGAVLAATAAVPLYSSVDVDRVAAELATATPGPLAVGAVLGLAAVVAGSELHRRLVAASGTDLAAGRFVLAYGAAHFVRSLLPFGQAAGPAVVAYAIRNESEGGYEEGLAAATVAELLTTAASLALAAVGLLALLATGGTAPVFGHVGVALLVVVVVLAAATAVAWRRRGAVDRMALAGAGVLRATLGRVSTRVRAATAPESVRDRLHGYYAVVDDIARNRRAVAGGFAVALLGWLALGGALFASAVAIDTAVPVAVVLLVPPASAIAAAFPSPGGLGATELALTGLLAALAGVPLAEAAAVALVYRVCVYWTPLAGGGLCALWLSAGSEAEPVPARTEPPVELEG